MNGIDSVRQWLATALLLLVFAAPALAQNGSPGQRQVGFVENRGQWSGPGRYLARYAGLDLWVTDDALVYDFHRAEGSSRRGHVVRMELGAAGKVSAGVSLGERHGFIRADRSVGTSAFADVAVRGVRPGVDLVLYDDGGRPRYDLHVAPGIDPRTISLRFSGADAIGRGDDGSLRIATSLGEVEQRELEAYQIVDGRRRRVACAFELRDEGSVGFSVGAYDPALPLVIDPLTFSTFLGGLSDDIINSIALDSSGNVYVAGETSSPDFPYVTGSYFATLRGPVDAFVSKLSADGTTLLYSTFIGGSSIDRALDVAVDLRGYAYVVGMTRSSDFPARGGYDSTYGGAADAFALKLDTNGSRLVYSSLFGGSSDDIATGVAAEPDGRIYVTGHTQSSSFPTTPGAYQTSSNGREAFAMKLETTGRTLLYSTFVGGGGDDQAVDLALYAGIAYIAGTTSSDGSAGSSFPVSTGAAQSNFGGLLDGFVTAIDTNGRRVIFSSLLGGNGDDEIRGVAVDGAGAAFVTGQTNSSNFPVTTGAIQSSISGVNDAFVTRISAAGTSIDFSTLIGGGGLETGVAVSVTPEGRTLVAGNTTSGNFPIVNGAVQALAGGGQDIFVSELSPLGNSLIYSSYLGGTGNDSVQAMTHPGGLSLYLAGGTSSGDFPTTVGAYSRFNRGGFDGFVTRFDIVQLIAPNGRNALCAGDSHLITWHGGSSVNYDLALSANNGLTWSPIALGVAGNSFLWGAPTALPAGTAYRIRVSVSGGPEFDASDTAFSVLAPPRVISHPSSLTRPEGSVVTFSASGTGSTPIGTIWQKSSDGGATWTTIEGFTGTTLAYGAVTAADDSLQFRALFANQCDTAITRVATLVVQAIRVLTPSGGEIFCAGTTQTITFTRQHVGAVNIELSANGVNWSVIASNVDADSFDWTIPTSLRSGGGYRIRVTQTAGNAFDEATGEFAIHSAASVVGDPESITAQAGAPATFSVAGNGFPGYTIQWQARASSGAPWVDIPNANVATLVINPVSAALNGSEYRAILSNPCGSDTSAGATLTVEGSTGVAGESASAISLTVQPNPVGAEATIAFSARHAADARLVLLDARGVIVRTLLDTRVDAGARTVRLETAGLPSGAYRIVLTLDGTSTTAPLTIVR